MCTAYYWAIPLKLGKLSSASRRSIVMSIYVRPIQCKLQCQMSINRILQFPFEELRYLNYNIERNWIKSSKSPLISDIRHFNLFNPFKDSFLFYHYSIPIKISIFPYHIAFLWKIVFQIVFIIFFFFWQINFNNIEDHSIVHTFFKIFYSQINSVLLETYYFFFKYSILIFMGYLKKN